MNRFLAVFSLACFVVLTACSGNRPFPSGRHVPANQLIEHFIKNRETFVQIRSMLLATDTNLNFVSVTSIRRYSLKSPVTDERIEQYRKLMSKVGVVSVEVYHDGGVSFTTSTAGHALTGSSQGIEYIVDPQRVDIVENIDAWKTTRKEDVMVHQHIDDKWYVYYEFFR